MRPKPTGTPEFPREQIKRDRDDRARCRKARHGQELGDTGGAWQGEEHELPWDCRGPPGPHEGGPTKWEKQKFRLGSGRWANSGGRHKEKYAMYNMKKNEGLTSRELAFWHPYQKDGYWERGRRRRGR